MEAWGLACANVLRLEIPRLLEAVGLESDVRGPVSSLALKVAPPSSSSPSTAVEQISPNLIPQGYRPETSKKNNILQAPSALFPQPPQ